MHADSRVRGRDEDADRVIQGTILKPDGLGSLWAVLLLFVTTQERTVFNVDAK